MISPSEVARHTRERYSLLGTKCLHCGLPTLEERKVCAGCEAQHVPTFEFVHDLQQSVEFDAIPASLLRQAAK